MELRKLIVQLRKERVKLDDTIASLEHLEKTIAETKKITKNRRGRKFMDAEARKEVSERMKKYWASRRAQIQKASGLPL